MGLDMYAYSAARAGQQQEFYEDAEFVDGKFVSTKTKPKEIMYWRKHPNLHGWMEQLWIRQGRPGVEQEDYMFNGIELELTEQDLNQLEQDIKNKNLPGTSGFFFGEGSDDYYREQDLKFIQEARADLFCGLRVFYNSSW